MRLLRGPTTLLFALLLATPLSAQTTGTIQGTVRGEDNQPLEGALVAIEALRVNTLTNANGRYVLANVPVGNHTVSVSILGYSAQTREGVVVAAGQPTVVDMQLRTEVLNLGEIVVTGVTEATVRAKLPFTVAKVTSENMPVRPTAALASVQGKVAGVNMVQGSQPGSGTDIVLRTPTSINRTNSPLIVVDGAILTESSVDISSLDIESIEVVKGAAAASLYGSRAAAGVIQIRTARGSQIAEGRTRFTVRSEFGSNSIMKPIDWSRRHNLRLNDAGTSFVNSAGQDTTRQYAAGTTYLFQDQPYPGQTYDHIDAFFDPGRYITNSVSLGFNGGNTSWLASASQHHTAGVLVGNDGYKRYDFRTNLDHRLRNDLAVSMTAFHMRGKQEDPGGDPFFDLIHQSPDINLRQPDPDGTRFAFQPDPAGIRANPLYQIATQEHWDHRSRTLGSIDLRYNPVSWLGFVANGSYDRSDRSSEDYVPRGVKTPESPTGGIGSADRSSAVTTGINASAGLTFARDFGALQWRSSARMLIEREDNESISAGADDAAVGGIPDLDAFLTLSNGSTNSAVRSRGYYLTGDLDYADKYIFSGLVRRDGSSLFGAEERWHNYYRASGAYRMSAEEWWPLGNTINEFKLYYSRGTAGGRPGFSDRFEVFGLGASGLTLATLGNIFLKPEKTTEQEFGVDIVALERLSLNVAYARQRTEDELVEVPLPALFGFGSQWQNAGTIKGNTIEGTLEARLIETSNVRWSITAIADRSRNRIEEYDRPCHYDGIGRRCAGAQLGEMYTQKLWRSPDDLPAVHANSRDQFQVNDDGLLVPVGTGRTWRDGTTGCTDIAPTTRAGCWGKNIVIDGVTYAWGMPRAVIDPVTGAPATLLTGDANPDANWGLSSQLRLGRFNIYALVGGQIGGDVYNSTKQRMYQYTRNREIDQDGKSEETKKPTTYYTGPLYNGNTRNDWFLEDGTYTKLREASIRYGITPRQLPALDRLGLQNVNLSLVGRNLFIITGYSGYDPEVGSVLTRIDSFTFPTYRTITFSIDIEF